MGKEVLSQVHLPQAGQQTSSQQCGPGVQLQVNLFSIDTFYFFSGKERTLGKQTNKTHFFRFAKYYRTAEGEEVRTLIKAYGIRFDVIVFGTVRLSRL